MALKHYIEVLPKHWELHYQRVGEIISRTVNLERIIDTMIASYFCHDDTKRDELLKLVLCTERITFESKRQVLKWIFETYDNSIIKAYPTLFKDLQNIGEYRNVLAHNHLDTTQFITDNIARKTKVNKYKNKKIEFEITDEVMNEKTGIITKCHHILQNWEGQIYLPI